MQLLILILFIVECMSWDCVNYALMYPETETTIPLEERVQYLPKVCGAVRTCHAHPQLFSYDIYVNDVSRCYELRMYNFNRQMFEDYREEITNYVFLIKEKANSELEYDVLNLKAKDSIQALVNVVRLRDAYLREFQYSSGTSLMGDVLLLLKSWRQTFALESLKQRSSVDSMRSNTEDSILSVNQLEDDLRISSERMFNVTARLQLVSIAFEDVVVAIQENVLGSLLELEND